MYWILRHWKYFICKFNAISRRITMQGKVEICGINTTHLSTLPQAEMDHLLRQVRQGDFSAR